MDPCGQPTGAAQRRRGRRLRAAWRHEQQSIAQALAAFTHHSAQRQKTARAGEEGHEEKNDAPLRQKPIPPQSALFSPYEDEPVGERPASLAEPLGPQAWVQRHTAEHIVDFVCFAPTVPLLDAPVPHSGDQLVDAIKHFDISVPEQVIEVSAQDILPTPSSSSGSRRHVDGGTVGGNARDRASCGGARLGRTGPRSCSHCGVRVSRGNV